MPKILDRPGQVSLAVSSPDEPSFDQRMQRLPYLPWVAAATVGSAGTVLLGWVAIGAVVAVGWLDSPTLAPATVLDTIAQTWVGLHGAPFMLGAVRLTLIPLGLTGLVGVALAAVSRYALAQTGHPEGASARMGALVAALCTGSYTATALLLATLVGQPKQATAVFGGALVLSAVASTIGVARSLHLRWPKALDWLRGSAFAVLVGGAVQVTFSVATLALALVSHGDEVLRLQTTLAPGTAGAVVLFFAYLAYAPTFVLWAGAYALGAGFTVGSGTLLTPTTSMLGLVPALPITAALPSVPPAYGVALMACGPLSGMTAGMTAAIRAGGRLGNRARVQASGAAGLVLGLSWTTMSWLSRGDLGTGRLVALGPRFPDMFGYGALMMTAGGLIGGLLVIAWNSRTRSSSS